MRERRQTTAKHGWGGVQKEKYDNEGNGDRKEKYGRENGKDETEHGK